MNADPTGNHSRREFLGLAATAAAGLAAPALFAPGAARGDTPRKPNILLILADDQGYGECSCQGCQDIPTPNIDSIAANGTRFTNGYVTCPICAPTRAGLMTGRYQQRFGFETNPGPENVAATNFGLELKEVTLAARMKSFGYATGMFGKWHLGFKPEFQPTARGFDEFFGFLSGANNYLAGTRDNRRNPLLRGTEPIQETDYLTDAFGREAIAFIEKHKDHPWFVYLPFNAVHSPLEATEAYKARFPNIQEDKRHTFAGMTAAMDDNVGRVLAKLRELNLEEDTLIFYLSDNGGPTPSTTSNNGVLRGYKSTTWEGGVRIPFMAQWKGHLPAGKVSDQIVVSMDIHATAVAAAGETVSPDWKLDGVNLLPYLTGEKTGNPHDTLCWRMFEKWGIRHGDYKIVFMGAATPKPQLFNLAEDIGEKTDLAEKEPEKLKELMDLYKAWDAQMEKPRWEWGGGASEEQLGARGRQLKNMAEGKSGGAGVAKGSQPRTGAALDRWKQADKNGDGQLTPDEVPNADQFKRMDANGDGVVTLDEARASFRGQGAATRPGRRRAGQ
ncbi:MAG: sulfatase-like hydrolase/transferase [Candidatus Sumerlaeota bacterium]|nr:sulfatase-like hydrolase/transferase [Candidatus Sumerlaeota bacterium]